jgi:hypothetical protein
MACLEQQHQPRPARIIGTPATARRPLVKFHTFRVRQYDGVLHEPIILPFQLLQSTRSAKTRGFLHSDQNVLKATRNSLCEEMSERHDHGKNLIGKARIQLFAKSFILQVYDVLAKHSQR